MVWASAMPRSAIIWTRSRELELKVRYHRTQSTMISWSKCLACQWNQGEGGGGASLQNLELALKRLHARCRLHLNRKASGPGFSGALQSNAKSASKCRGHSLGYDSYQSSSSITSRLESYLFRSRALRPATTSSTTSSRSSRVAPSRAWIARPCITAVR
jgi:hypothetical protein